MKHDNPAGTVWKTAGRALFVALYVAVFFWLVLPQRAEAAVQCAPYKAMVQLLLDRFEETPQSIGLIDDRRIMQVFTASGGSWTILVTTNAGQSCILAAGTGFETARPAKGSEEPPVQPGDPA
jgi:hypothetical protein